MTSWELGGSRAFGSRSRSTELRRARHTPRQEGPGNTGLDEKGRRPRCAGATSSCKLNTQETALHVPRGLVPVDKCQTLKLGTRRAEGRRVGRGCRGEVRGSCGDPDKALEMGWLTRGTLKPRPGERRGLLLGAQGPGWELLEAGGALDSWFSKWGPRSTAAAPGSLLGMLVLGPFWLRSSGAGLQSLLLQAVAGFWLQSTPSWPSPQHHWSEDRASATGTEAWWRMFAQASLCPETGWGQT